jgi:hypothetical protein
MIMRQTLATVAAAAAIGFALATTAAAQVIVVDPAGAYAPQGVVYAPQTARVVCEVRREPINDERGWRVRDMLVCVPR